MDFGDGKMGEEESQSRDDEQKVNKNLQAIMLLKKKMAKTDMLIRQFNDKTMECNALKEELAAIRSDKQDLLNKYNVSLEKMTRLELTNEEYEKSIKDHQAIANKQDLKLDENDQHINQLTYKIKDLEAEINVLQSEIKNTKIKKTEKKSNVQAKEQAIQTDLKVCDSSINTDPINIIQEKLEMKHQNTMTNPVKHVFKQPDVRDQAIMTESIEPIFKKPQMKHQKLMTESTKSISKRVETKNKGIVTDECINAKNEPFPFYCSKCEILIQPAPVKQILRIMTAPPPLLSECLSPPHSPTLPKSNIEDYREEDTVMSIERNYDNNVTQFSFNDKKYENETPITNEKPCSSFMEIDKLSRKISKLEKLVKKKKLKNNKNSCCHNNNCGSLKNVKFIVQLPNEEKIFEYRKREKRKIKRLQNVINKDVKKRKANKRKRNSERQDGDWKVENCSKPKKRKIVPEKKINSNKKTKLTNQQFEELFECSEISDCDERSSINTSPPILETNQTQPKSIHMESVPLPDIRREMNTDISKKPIDEDTLNVTELIRKDKVSADSFIPSQSTEKNEEPMQTNQPQPKSVNMESVPLPDIRKEMNADISKKPIIDEDTLNVTELTRKDEVSADRSIPSQSTDKNEEAMQLPTAQLDNTTNVIVVNEQTDILTELPNNEIINCTDREPIDNKFKKSVLNEKADKSINFVCDKLYDATEEKSNKPKLSINTKLEENDDEHVRSPEMMESSKEYALPVPETSIVAEKSSHFSIPDEVDQKHSSRRKSNEQSEEFDSIEQIASFPNSDNVLCKLVKENRNQASEVENEKLISVKEYTGDRSENILSFENTKSFKKCDSLTSESDNDETINFNISNANHTINECVSKNEINRQAERIDNSAETTSLTNDNYENIAHKSTNKSHCLSLNANLKEGAKKYLISCEESPKNSENVNNSDVCPISSSGREINTNIEVEEDFNVIDNIKIINDNVSTKERNLQNGECENISKVDAINIDQSLMDQSSSTEQFTEPEDEKSFMHEDVKKLFGGLSSIQQFPVSKVKRDLTHKNIEKIKEKDNQQINSTLNIDKGNAIDIDQSLIDQSSSTEQLAETDDEKSFVHKGIKKLFVGLSSIQQFPVSKVESDLTPKNIEKIEEEENQKINSPLNIGKVDAIDIDESLIDQSSNSEQLAEPEDEKSFMHKDIKKLFGGLTTIQQFPVSKLERDVTPKNIETIKEEGDQKIKSELVENNLERISGLSEVIQDSVTYKDEQSSVTTDEKEIMEDMFVEGNNSNVTNIEPETTIEIVSSSESSESQFLISPKKKSNNVIRSDDSDEKPTDEPNAAKRKRSGKIVKRDEIVIPRKKFLTKIRNIKKNSVKPMTISKSKPCTSQSIPTALEVPIETVTAKHDVTCVSDTSIDSSSSCLLVKKQRIAHTPKRICTNTEIIDQEQKTVPKIIKKTKLNSKSTHESEAKVPGDEISSILEVFDKTCKERAEIYRNLNVAKSVQAESISLRNLISNDVQICSNKSHTDSPMEETISNDYNVNSPNNATKDENELDSLKEEDKTVESSCISNKTKLKKKTVKISDEVTSPIRALRSRQVVIDEKTPKAKRKRTKKSKSSSRDPPVLISETNSSLKNTTIVSFLNEHISTQHSHYLRDKADIMNARKNQNFIQEQLDLLMAEEWTMDINTQVVENLTNSQELRTIAVFMIDFTADKIVDDKEFDKTHTPPAPMMVRSEQKIVTLILSINKKHPEFMDIVIEGIQYKLFRLGMPQQVQIVERLFRILVVLSKIKKDREKVRIFCCDALYCLSLRAVNIIYVALTCWPEILPKHDSNNDIIVKTIVHIVMTLQVSQPYPKLNSLRKLLSTYYEYPNSGYMTNTLKVELFKNLQENAPGIHTAILLLCKKMGPEWASENIVRNLKQMIVTQMHPSLYEVLNLLGNVLRSFPASDPNNAVDETIDQLCDVLDGNAGEYDLQEGIVACLLSISKFKFEQVALSVIKWQSNNDLRPTTKDKLKSFFKQHDGKWWEIFVKNNFPLPE